MKRDMEVVKKICQTLINVQEYSRALWRIEGIDEEILIYHLHLLANNGFVREVEATTSWDEPSIEAYSLTWEGHCFANGILSSHQEKHS